ncbi:NAD(P)/FAD-dependent oxidoreductase [Nocardiopsis mwathae]|uniref:NAD(P)/FAD-dependent oxidoreductase n=1 Tax=Nocardiopsis mwathae TaxID=1472723 RepID=UPI0031B57F3D
MAVRADIVVIGAGIIGAACARELAGAECSVTVLDRAAAASATTAHGEGNILVSDKAPGPELDLARASVRLWPQAVAELGEELGPRLPDIEWDRKGGLVVATTAAGAAGLGAFAREQRQTGVDAQPVDLGDVPGLEPNLSRDITAAVRYPEDAQVQPVAAAEALLASARTRGARVRQATAVLGPIRDRSGALRGVHTTAGPWHTPVVLNAAGPWAGRVARLLGAPVPVRPRRGMVLVTARVPPWTVRHKVYDADYVATVADTGGESEETTASGALTSSVVESTAAGPLLVGSSRRHVGFDDRLRVDVLARIAAKAVRLFPGLADVPVIRAYGGFRPGVPDHLPIIGPDERVPGLWHATGHEGAGIGLSVATARLIRQMILEEPPVVDPRPFRPLRPGLAAATSTGAGDTDRPTSSSASP